MRKETLLATLGFLPENSNGTFNVPVHRASTLLFKNLAALEASERGEPTHGGYARFGTPSTKALEETLAALEGADQTVVTASGLSACVVALLAFLKNGDHLLMVDSVYGATRKFCDHQLKDFGVEVTYYDPLIGAGIASLIKPNTKVVYVESPGSLTFEVQDIPAIARAAHAKGCVVIGDNTWATPLHIKPFDLGMDVSVHSATKYIGGHSDLMMGVISAKKPHAAKIWSTFIALAPCASGDNAYLALRGLRSMAVRLKHQCESSLKIAQWLKNRPEVEVVLHPAFPGSPGHDIWKRDFTGGASLFTFALKSPISHAGLAAMFDGLELFGMGYSWGGFESLITPVNTSFRKASKWPYGQGIRLHIGLEHTDDLIRDLEKGFERLKTASANAA